jgi:hypothetical protein
VVTIVAAAYCGLCPAAFVLVLIAAAAILPIKPIP